MNNKTDICMHCDKPIYDSENPAPEGLEHFNSGLIFYHELTERSLGIHYCCLMDMMKWVSDKMKQG